MSVININDIDFRAATQEDFDYVYNLFRRLMLDYHLEYWGKDNPEKCRIIVSSAFERSGLQILSYNREPVGCCALYEDENSIEIGTGYLEEAFQRAGLGAAFLERGLAAAHEKQKPLQARILGNNTPSLNFASKNGFEEYERKTTSVTLVYLRHKDTFQYL